MDIGLCKPSSTILLVSTAGVIYHLLAGDTASMMWWIIVGVTGTGVFQSLCYGGLEPVAWILMSIPVLIVCFFLAVALFASRMRIENIVEVPCGSNGCSHCQSVENQACPNKHDMKVPAVEKFHDAQSCDGSGCPYCAYAASLCRDCLGRGCASCNRETALSTY